MPKYKEQPASNFEGSRHSLQYLELLISRAKIIFSGIPACVVDPGRLFRCCSALEKLVVSRPHALDCFLTSSTERWLALRCMPDFNQLNYGLITKIANAVPNLKRFDSLFDLRYENLIKLQTPSFVSFLYVQCKTASDLQDFEQHVYVCEDIANRNFQHFKICEK